MRRFVWFCLSVCLFIAAAACRGPGGDLRGATPAGYLRPIVNATVEGAAEPVTIADLLESPEMYEGDVIEVSGTYYQRQVIVCSTRPQRSPARWSLSDGEGRIPVAGMNENLEELPSGRIDISVLGRWLRWQGPVGCGRQAQVTEVWYLDVLDVLSPNPITIAAVGSEDGGISSQSEPSNPTPDAEGGYPGPDGGTETVEITETAEITGTTQPELPEPVGTPPEIGPTPSVTSDSSPNPTATPTVQAADGTPSVTPSPETTNGTTPTPTPTLASGGEGPVTVEQEVLPPGSIETAQLGTNEVHSWPFVITSTAVITVNIASELELDAVIMIQDPSGNVIAQQNDAQDGAPEVLTNVELTELGTYSILITSENETAGYYAILVTDVLNEDYYTFVFNGTIVLGGSDSAILRENNDQFWHFGGMGGDVVTIRVTPSDNSDLFIRLFGPDGTLLVDFENETEEGEAEEILSFALPDTGFYSILIGELNFGEATYTITLTSG